MRCGHPSCNRGIGLLSHRRWFSNKLYCSKACRDDYVSKPRQLLEQPMTLALAPVPVRAVARRSR
jgi:hypothetical protein